MVRKTGVVKYEKKPEKGARMRMRDWKVGLDCMAGDLGEPFYDIVIYKTLRYLCLKSHTATEALNPQTDVASAPKKSWASATEWEFIASKLALVERIKAEDIDADNLVAKNVDVEGTIRATAAFIKIHGFRTNEGYFFLNPKLGSDFGNGRPNRISQSVYMLPDAAQYVGMKISLLIYNTVMSSTYGYISVVTTNVFDDYEYVGDELHFCNKAHISNPGVYEFISLGGTWILANRNSVSYSYADLGNHTYEDPIS